LQFLQITTVIKKKKKTLGLVPYPIEPDSPNPHIGI